MGVGPIRMVIRDRSLNCPFMRTQSIDICVSQGIGLAGTRSQVYDHTEASSTLGQGEYPYEDYDEDAVTEDSEEMMSDDGDDSGSLTSVD